MIRPQVFSGLESIPQSTSMPDHWWNELDKSPSEVPLDKQLCWSSKALHWKISARGNTAMPEGLDELPTKQPGANSNKLLPRVPLKVQVGECTASWSDSLVIQNYPNNFTMGPILSELPMHFVKFIKSLTFFAPTKWAWHFERDRCSWERLGDPVSNNVSLLVFLRPRLPAPSRSQAVVQPNEPTGRSLWANSPKRQPRRCRFSTRVSHEFFSKPNVRHQS